MTSRSARTTRGLVAAVISVFVAAFSHVAGGGDAPGTVGLVIALAFSSLVCVALAGRALSLPRLAVSVGFSQLALHLLFSVGAAGGAGAASTAGSGSVAGSMASMPGMSHAGSAVLTSLFAQNATTATGSALPCSWMWAAHTMAAVITIAALRHGEAAFWGLLATARLLVLRFVRLQQVEPLAPDAQTLAVRALGPEHPQPSHLFLDPLRHRGPPLYSFS